MCLEDQLQGQGLCFHCNDSYNRIEKVILLVREP